MKLYFLSIVCILLAVNVSANEEEIELEVAPASWVAGIYEDCLNYQQDEEQQGNDVLACVNQQLIESSYQAFTSLSALKATIENEG